MGRFEARLGRLGTRLVLEVRPAPHETSEPEAALLLPGHLLLLLDIEEEEVRLALLEPDSLEAALVVGAVNLPYVLQNDQLILTGTTEQLRSALTEYVARAGALGEPSRWRRTPRRPPTAETPARAGQDPCFEASVWPEAGRLFRADARWVGSDGAYSIDLGRERTLWLFGDTWIDPSGLRSRRGARMIRNSVAIQTGSDPAHAAIAFYWGEAPAGGAAAFFPEQGEHWFWPGHGIYLDDRLLLFLMRLRAKRGGLGFESAGWNAVMISNPDEEPPRWRVSWLDNPRNDLGVVIGSASVIRLGNHVYAFGSQEPVTSHPMYVVRWPVEHVRQGRLRSLEWWGGTAGWVADSSREARWPAFLDGQSELTVHYEEVSQRFLAVQTIGFGPADVAIRSAPELTGPWTAPRMIYRPAEFYRPNVMIYAAKAHPQLTGADLVLTYATNTFQFAEQIEDSLIYYPRFVRLARCR